MSLCVCCCKECFKNKATKITLRNSRTEKLVPFDRKLCLYSSYQIEGCFVHLSPLSRIQASLTSVVSKSKCCLSFLSYKMLYKKTKSFRIPRKGLIARTLWILLVLVSFTIPTVRATFDLMRLKLNSMMTKKDPKLLYSMHLANESSDNMNPVKKPKVFTTKRSKGAYAYSFDSDTKTMVDIPAVLSSYIFTQTLGLGSSIFSNTF